VKRALLCAVVASAVACASDSGGGGTPTNPSPNPSQPTITITASGVAPRELTISAGQRVLFVNNDSRAHQMNSDPHPDHGDCPAIDQVGFLAPGQSKETGNFVFARTCGYHDHNLFEVDSLQGRIIVR
jgi:plastocyanin